MSLTKEARELLNKYGTRPIKSLGQNFLINEHVLDKIVAAADITEKDFIIEIGPGLGFLTRKMAGLAKHVLAVDLDAKMVEILEKEVTGNIKIIHGDALKTDWQGELAKLGWQGEKVKVVANLPYYITTPILFMFLEGDLPVAMMVMMMQREVADRIMAPPGGKDYGALSVAVQYRCKVDEVCFVSAGSFLPPPEVESSVLRFSFYDQKPVEAKNEETLLKVIKAAFSQRRKTLRNTLRTMFPDLKSDLPQVFEEAGISGERRGETLSVAEFVKLADLIYMKIK